MRLSPGIGMRASGRANNRLNSAAPQPVPLLHRLQLPGSSNSSQPVPSRSRRTMAICQIRSAFFKSSAPSVQVPKNRDLHPAQVPSDEPNGGRRDFADHRHEVAVYAAGVYMHRATRFDLLGDASAALEFDVDGKTRQAVAEQKMLESLVLAAAVANRGQAKTLRQRLRQPDRCLARRETAFPGIADLVARDLRRVLEIAFEFRIRNRRANLDLDETQLFDDTPIGCEDHRTQQHAGVLVQPQPAPVSVLVQRQDFDDPGIARGHPAGSDQTHTVNRIGAQYFVQRYSGQKAGRKWIVDNDRGLARHQAAHLVAVPQYLSRRAVK